MRSAVTIGNFDGVHRGHRALLDAIMEFKRSQPNTPPKTVVISFDPHPSEILRPGTLVPRLCSTEQRQKLLYSAGADEVLIVPFTLEFSKTSAHDFFKKVLVEQLHMQFLAVGENFFFGHQRGGTPAQLIRWCSDAGIASALVNPIESDGSVISSSRIRKLIGDGQMVAAARLLGRDYSIRGEVVRGDQRGRTLGFPTANLRPQASGSGAICIPAYGVYLSASTVDGRTFASITNVGVKPTVQALGSPGLSGSSGAQVGIESHLLDFDGDLYGKLLSVEFRDRLRGEIKFKGLSELTQQIQADVQIARARLTNF